MKAAFERLRNRTPVGWLQLRRNRTRFLVAIAGIAFADLLMFMQLGVLGAALDTSVLFHNMLQADIVLISPEARDLQNSGSIARSRLYQAESDPGVASGSAMYIGFLDWRAPITNDRRSMMVIGTDPDSPMLSFDAVRDRREELKQANTLVFDRLSRGDYKPAIARLDAGKPLTAEIDRTTIHLAGTYQLGAAFGSDGSMIGSETTFLHLFPGHSARSITLGLLKVKPGQDSALVEASIKRKMSSDVRVLTKAEFIAYARNFQAKATPVGFIFGLGTVMGFIVGLAMVYQVLSTDVADHLAEYATFKAMGFTNAYLLGIIAEECVILAVVGFFPGLLAGEGLMKLMHIATFLPTSLPLSRMLLVFGLTLVLCLILGWVAARRLRTADPADVFA